MSISNVTFDATPGGAADQVDGGMLAVGDQRQPDRHGRRHAQPRVQGSLSFTDLDVFAGTSGSDRSWAGHPGGEPPAVSTISAANGPAVDVSTAAINLQLASLTSTTSAAGVALASVTGTFSAAAGSSITKASGAGTAFAVSGSNVAVAYAGSLNVTSGAGVSLTGNNAAATFTFSGGMTLTTGANAAFTATGGGTVAVCDENPCNPAATGALVNTMTTTTGTALNVASTTIGANNLEFRSITAGTAAGSAGVGINLDTTGASGGLRVKGTGAVGSGGTIQHKTGANGSTTGGIGIYMNATANVQLAWMQLNDFDNHGIRGIGVTNFRMTDSRITGLSGTKRMAPRWRARSTSPT